MWAIGEGGGASGAPAEAGPGRSAPAARAAAVVGGAALAAAALGGALSVRRIEARTLDVVGAVGAGRALIVNVRGAERVDVQVCASRAALRAGPVDDAPRLVVTVGGALGDRPRADVGGHAGGARGTLASLALTEAALAHARADARRACWTVARADVPEDARLAATLDPAAAEDGLAVAPKVRVAVRRPAGLVERGWMLLATFGALSVALALVLGPSPGPSIPPEPPRRRTALAVACAAVVAGVVAFAAVARVPIEGGLGGLVRGGLLAAAEIAIALGFGAWLARRTASDGPRGAGFDRAVARGARSELGATLGAGPPRGGGVVLALAPLVGVGLAAAGVVVARSVPSTGEAPIEAFVARPAGSVALALLALLAPVGEELLFRGLLYRAFHEALRGPRGAAAAWLAGALSSVCFVAAHLPQAHGAWGGLGAIALVAAVTAALRIATGSTAASLLAHLAYNTMLAWPVLLTAE
jgi:membrane protease YdiL (CAAX protease family)